MVMAARVAEDEGDDGRLEERYRCPSSFGEYAGRSV